MHKRRRKKLSGLVPPMLGGQPLLVRLCEAFVDNLGLLLRVALVVGAIAFVRDLRTLPQPEAADTRPPAVAEIVESDDEQRGAETAPDSPVLSEGVKQAFNCTFKAYRDAHYRKCVQEPSDVYQKPLGDDDDTSFLNDEAPSMLAQSFAVTDPNS